MKKTTPLDELGSRVIAKISEIDKVIGLAWSLQWSENVSCTHSAPVGCCTNWTGSAELPTHYPGWQGRIWIRFEPNDNNRCASDLLKTQHIHAGTGGSGSYSGPWSEISGAAWRGKKSDMVECYSWDVKIFDADFPEIAEKNNKDLMWSILQRKKRPTQNHRFEWTDPAVLEQDRSYLILSMKTVK